MRNVFAEQRVHGRRVRVLSAAVLGLLAARLGVGECLRAWSTGVSRLRHAPLAAPVGGGVKGLRVV